MNNSLRLLAAGALVFLAACTPDEAPEASVQGWDDVRSTWGDRKDYGSDSADAQQAWAFYSAYSSGSSSVAPYGCNATTVVSLTQGLNNQGNPVVPSRSDPNKALGAPQDDDTENFVALGFGGELVLGFPDPLLNGAGNDFTVIETSYGSPSCAAYPEHADVFASQDGVTWTHLGNTCQDGSFDLGALPWALYLKFHDTTSLASFPGGVADGYDVDGIIGTCGDACPDWIDTLELEVGIEYFDHHGFLPSGWPIYYLGDTMRAELSICNPTSHTVDNLSVTTMEEDHYTDALLACSTPVSIWTGITLAPLDCITLTYTFYLDPATCMWGNYQTHVLIARDADAGCPTAALIFEDAEVGIYDPPSEG